MLKEKVVRESEYNKTVQFTSNAGGARTTYCINYRKVFHISYTDGFKWVAC